MVSRDTRSKPSLGGPTASTHSTAAESAPAARAKGSECRVAARVERWRRRQGTLRRADGRFAHCVGRRRKRADFTPGSRVDHVRAPRVRTRHVDARVPSPAIAVVAALLHADGALQPRPRLQARAFRRDGHHVLKRDARRFVGAGVGVATEHRAITTRIGGVTRALLLHGAVARILASVTDLRLAGAKRREQDEQFDQGVRTSGGDQRTLMRDANLGRAASQS